MSVDRPSSQIVVSVVHEGEHMQIKTIPLDGAFSVHNTASDSYYIVYTEACSPCEAQCECPSDTYHEGRCKHRQAIDKIAEQFITQGDNNE
jgi:hypothetical protein